MHVGVLPTDDKPTIRAYPDYEGHKVLIVVSGAAAEDVQALMVTRATQLTNSKLHPVIKETVCVFFCVCVSVCMLTVLWLWMREYMGYVLYLCSRLTLTTQGHDSSSECIQEVLVEPPLYTDNDWHQPPVCNNHQPMRRRTEPLRANETPLPLWSDRDTE